MSINSNFNFLCKIWSYFFFFTYLFCDIWLLGPPSLLFNIVQVNIMVHYNGCLSHNYQRNADWFNKTPIPVVGHTTKNSNASNLQYLLYECMVKYMNQLFGTTKSEWSLEGEETIYSVCPPVHLKPRPFISLQEHVNHQSKHYCHAPTKLLQWQNK